ncbi:MAG: PEGA domain-containing protein [Polyangiales bacterium]
MTLLARRTAALAALLIALARSRADAQVAPDDAGAPPEASPSPQPPPPAVRAVDPVREEARAHFQRGVELIGAERWADAILELRRAQELRATPAVLFNLGLALRAVGRNREAMAAFREFSRMSGATTNPELAARVDAYVQELTAGLGRVVLLVEPPSATVQIDGLAVRANESVEVDPGRHVIIAAADGFAGENRTVEVARGSQSTVMLRMVPLVLSSRVTVTADPSGALVRIDGQNVGFGSVEETVRPGSHTLEVSAEGYYTFRRRFEALAGQSQTLRANLSNSRGVVESPWFWLGVGALAAGGGVAAFFLLQDLAPPYQGTLGNVTDALTVRGGR